MAAIVSRMALAMEFTFVMGLAREAVITILVKRSSTNACCLDEGGGKDWEAKATEEGESVGGAV
jgi:hypothetical protein